MRATFISNAGGRGGRGGRDLPALEEPSLVVDVVESETSTQSSAPSARSGDQVKSFGLL